MARTKADLINEARGHELYVDEGMSTKLIMDKLRDHYWTGKDILPQYEIMKAKDAAGAKCANFDFELDDFYNSSYMQRHFWNNPNLVAELKENGVHYKMHLVDIGIQVDSSRRSDAHYAFSEKTDNFPHFINFKYDKELVGSVLDCEFRHKLAVMDTGSVVTASTLASSVAVCNSGPDLAHMLQQKYGPIDAYCFDILFYKGVDVRDRPWWKRRELLEAVIVNLNHPNIKLSTVCPENMTKLEFFEWILEQGLEGIIFKEFHGRYESGKRSRNIWKLKKVFTVEAFISGFIAGEHGNTGMVGSICVSMMHDGNIREVGAFSNITDEQRLNYTAPDGSLKREYYDKVVELRFFEISKNYRMSHARITEWRPDKSPMDCQFVEQFQLS